MRFGQISQQVVGIPVRKFYLGQGDEAISNTVRMMRDIVKASSGNYYVRRWAEKIVQGVEEKDSIGRINTIFNFIRGNSRYLNDPKGFEMLKTPLVTLQLWDVGDYPLLDCDDYTILSLSLLKTIGFPVAIRAVSYRPDGKFTHVYGMVNFKNEWIPLDLIKDFGPGWEAPGITRTMDLEVG